MNKIQMSKWWFQFILSTLVWILMFLPFWLPEKWTIQQKLVGSVWYKWAEIWMMITAVTMILFSYIGPWSLTGKLHDWWLKCQQDKWKGI